MINGDGKFELEGDLVKLVPIELYHKDGLLQAASDGRLWEIWHTSVPSAATIDPYIAKAIEERENGASLPFAVVHKPTNTIIGSTRYCNIDPANRRLEIGYTWYAKSHQRSGVNTECKYLLLKHAFSNFNVIAVEFKTNWFNYASRNAILRLGAKQDGVLRNHRIDKEGILRDTVVFSIIASEWISVRKSLEYQIKKSQ